jgi:hypothetical protein
MPLARHGEADHNARSEWTLRDPSLTLQGRRQARSAQASLTRQGVLGIDDAARAQLVVASPMRRTLQTAEILTAGVIVPVLAHPDLQETSQAACDTGHPRAVLQAHTHTPRPISGFSWPDPHCSWPDRLSVGLSLASRSVSRVDGGRVSLDFKPKRRDSCGMPGHRRRVETARLTHAPPRPPAPQAEFPTVDFRHVPDGWFGPLNSPKLEAQPSAAHD